MALLLAACAEPVRTTFEDERFGEPLNAELWTSGEAEAREAQRGILFQLDEVARVMSPDGEGSQLAELNATAVDEFFPVEDRDFYKVLTLALDYAQFSRGAYDPTIAPLEKLYRRSSGRFPTPGELEVTLGRVGWDKVTVAREARAFRFLHPGLELDPSVVVRGFALDAAARSFARAGSHGALLRLGNTMLVWGYPPPGEDDWTVRIRDPRTLDDTLLEIRTSNRGIGIAGHRESDVRLVLDPRDGLPASTDILAAVAIADSAADASALAEALFVMGSHAAGDMLGRMIRAEAVLLAAGNGEPYLLASVSLKDRLVLSPALEAEIAGRVRFLLPPESITIDLPDR